MKISLLRLSLLAGCGVLVQIFFGFIALMCFYSGFIIGALIGVYESKAYIDEQMEEFKRSLK